MLITSQVIASGSGSVGGLTLSHNSGGLYFRARVIPTNPSTIFQTAIRVAVASLTARWIADLTQVQRDAWELYAANVPLPGPLGNPRPVSGLAMYIRGNVSRIQTGEPVADDAATVFDLSGFTPIAGEVIGGQVLAFTFTNVDDWANADDAAMLVYMSRPQNVTINFFQGPYRFADKIQGDATTAPTSPAAITSPFTLVPGQRVFGYIRVTREDGRYSAKQDFDVITA